MEDMPQATDAWALLQQRSLDLLQRGDEALEALQKAGLQESQSGNMNLSVQYWKSRGQRLRHLYDISSKALLQ